MIRIGLWDTGCFWFKVYGLGIEKGRVFRVQGLGIAASYWGLRKPYHEIVIAFM